MDCRIRFAVAMLTCAVPLIPVRAPAQASRWRTTAVDDRLSVTLPASPIAQDGDHWIAAAPEARVAVRRERDPAGAKAALEAQRSMCEAGAGCRFVRNATVPGSALAFVMAPHDAGGMHVLAVADGPVTWMVMTQAKDADFVFGSVSVANLLLSPDLRTATPGAQRLAELDRLARLGAAEAATLAGRLRARVPAAAPEAAGFDAAVPTLVRAARLVGEQRRAEAQMLLREAIVAMPDDPRLYRQLADTYLDGRDFAAARVFFDEAIWRTPNDADAQFGRGRATLLDVPAGADAASAARAAVPFFTAAIGASYRMVQAHAFRAWANLIAGNYVTASSDAAAADVFESREWAVPMAIVHYAAATLSRGAVRPRALETTIERAARRSPDSPLRSLLTVIVRPHPVANAEPLIASLPRDVQESARTIAAVKLSAQGQDDDARRQLALVRTPGTLPYVWARALEWRMAPVPQPRPLRLRKPLPAGWTMTTIEGRLSVGVPAPIKSTGTDAWVAADGPRSVAVARHRDRRGLSSHVVLQATRARCVKGDRCTFVRDATVTGASLAFVMRGPEFGTDVVLAIADGGVSWTVTADPKIADAVFDSVRLVGGSRK